MVSDDKLNNFIGNIRRNWVFIALLLIVLLGFLLFALNTAGEFQKQALSYEQYIKDNCYCKGQILNPSSPIIISDMGVIDNEQT